MKKNARPTNVKASAPGKVARILAPKPRSFEGTENLRWLRILHALMTRSRTREDVDRIAGASNGPAAIAALRALGLAGHLLCEKTPVIDRDGLEVQRGVYFLTAKGRRMVGAWLTRRSRRRMS